MATTTRRLVPFALLGALTVAAAVTAWASPRGSGPASTKGPEGVPIYAVPNLAPRSTTATGAPVDGITCRKISAEVVKYHVHIYLSFYVDGKRERVPAGVGITTPYLTEHTSHGPFLDVGVYDCLYWLHTHAADDIVHVESPYRHTFTLGQFFDVWGQPLSADRVGPARGPVVVFVNGRRWAGSPRGAPLLAHAVIQVDVGSPVVAFRPVTFHVTGSCGEGTTSCSGPPTTG
ncbi:MAG TPA: hypothetical protein VGS61_03105 [Acidimicrobiales bacterium]|nr:hypothetical protein [Acidimicrobiales bacterium]